MTVSFTARRVPSTANGGGGGGGGVEPPRSHASLSDSLSSLLSRLDLEAYRGVLEEEEVLEVECLRCVLSH